jgi:hypothetical protein
MKFETAVAKLADRRQRLDDAITNLRRTISDQYEAKSKDNMGHGFPYSVGYVHSMLINMLMDEVKPGALEQIIKDINDEIQVRQAKENV